MDLEDQLACAPQEHAPQAPLDEEHIERTARIFRALGEPARLRLLARLSHKPACVSELALAERESVTTISQRLRVLRSENIVRGRKQGKHTVYALADAHMRALAQNALAHASHISIPDKERYTMATTCTIHENHTHQHGADCGHTALQHDDHVDYLHDGHLHSVHEDHVDEHAIEVSSANPAECTEGHDCAGHEAGHQHGPDCGHEAVPHGDHTDYLVAGHLHHFDGDHCDHHGAVTVIG